MVIKDASSRRLSVLSGAPQIRHAPPPTHTPRSPGDPPSTPADPKSFRLQGDAFILFVDRMRPDLFEGRGEGAEGEGSNQEQLQESAGLAASPPRPYPAAGGGERRAKPRLVRSYRSREEAWARSRRRKVPTRILEDLLAAWRAGTEGLTPAEYGAAFVGHPEVMRGGGGGRDVPQT